MTTPMTVDRVDIMTAYLGEDWETNPSVVTELSSQFGPDWKAVITRKTRQHYKDLARARSVCVRKRNAYYLTSIQQQAIIEAYQNLTPVQKLAEEYHVNRITIYKLLKRAGVDTTRQKLPVSCSTCGKELLRTKARIRNQKNHYCDGLCYGAFIKAGTNILQSDASRKRGQQRGRKVVSELFNLQAKHIVHHEDHNTLNNNLWNLRVFANQGDHIRYHRGFDVSPIWDGSVID